MAARLVLIHHGASSANPGAMRHNTKGTNIMSINDPDKARLDLMRAQNVERLSRVYAQAVGELRRLAHMTPDADGKVDLMKLDAALVGKPIADRMRLKGLLSECGAI
jgi:hypothetical protein